MLLRTRLSMSKSSTVTTFEKSFSCLFLEWCNECRSRQKKRAASCPPGKEAPRPDDRASGQFFLLLLCRSLLGCRDGLSKLFDSRHRRRAQGIFCHEAPYGRTVERI